MSPLFLAISIVCSKDNTIIDIFSAFLSLLFILLGVSKLLFPANPSTYSMNLYKYGKKLG